MDEQPPNRPPRPRPQPARRRAAAGRSRTAEPSVRGAEPRRRQPRPAPPARRSRPPVDHEVDESAESAGAAPSRRRSQTKLVVILSVLTVVVVGLAGFGLVLSSRSSGSGVTLPPDDNTPVPTTHFNDPDTGASLDYPRSWRRVEVPNATYRLVLDGGNQVAMTLRVFPTEQPTTADNLANIKAVTDGIVASNGTVNVLKQQAIQLNGMVGYYYFYTFNDNNGLQAVHAHYFLFQGRKMNMIVFQSLADDFQKNADTFDKIAESFHSDPAVAAPATTPTTAATTTTTG